MPTPQEPSRSRARLLAAVVLATALAAWLRTYGITQQVVIDDEWHALHKLMSAGYGGILKTFGMADHSIPLTVLYKAMAGSIGLAEGRLRAPQFLSGIALVPLAAWLAWRATRDAPAAALFAFLVSGAPFLVMWSRFARSYAVELLLVVAFVGLLWRWRTERSRVLAAWIAVTAALAAWFHVLAGLYVAAGWLFVFVEDVAARRARPRAWRSSLALGFAIGGAALVLLWWPLRSDWRSLTGKAGGDYPNLDTFERMLAIVWGGMPTSAMALASLVAAWGVVVLARRAPRLAAYLVTLVLLPLAFVSLRGASYVFGGQNLLRYNLPLLPAVLFFGAVGMLSVVRALARDAAGTRVWIASAALAAAYLAATPAIMQVATLGTWYGHLDYHWDYRYRWLDYMASDRSLDPPAFYRELGRMPPGSAPLIEAPFLFEAPRNSFDYYAKFHRQPETFGMLHDLCRAGPRIGEPPPHDRRFRFRRFVFLDDVQAVRQTGARYLLLHRSQPRAGPFPDSERCMAKLTGLYGAPMLVDDRLVVWDLRPGEPAPPRH